MSTENSIPEEFVKVIRDFVGDLKTTFPEYIPFIDKWLKTKEHFNYIDDEEERNNTYEKSEKLSPNIKDFVLSIFKSLRFFTLKALKL